MLCGLTHSPWQRARLVCHFYKCEQCSRSDDTSVANACAKRSPTLAVCVLPSNETERSRVCNWHVFVHASHAYDKHTHLAGAAPPIMRPSARAAHDQHVMNVCKLLRTKTWSSHLCALPVLTAVTIKRALHFNLKRHSNLSHT